MSYDQQTADLLTENAKLKKSLANCKCAFHDLDVKNTALTQKIKTLHERQVEIRKLINCNIRNIESKIEKETTPETGRSYHAKLIVYKEWLDNAMPINEIFGEE